jgi:hypothetical protein
MLIYFAVLYRLQRDALKDKMQLIGTYLHTLGIQIECRYFKCPLFKPTIKNRKNSMFVNQEFQVCSGLFNEYKSVSLRDQPPKLISDNATKLVETLANIGLFAIKVI